MAEGSAARQLLLSGQHLGQGFCLGVCVRTNAAARDNYITAGQIIAAAQSQLMSAVPPAHTGGCRSQIEW
jgi:hypothetical protein